MKLSKRAAANAEIAAKYKGPRPITEAVKALKSFRAPKFDQTVEVCVHLGIDPLMFLGAFVLPHGLLEIPSVILVGALNLRIGLALMAPPHGFSFGESLLLSLVNWVKGAALFVPLLLVAAVVETEVTPLIALRLFGG